MQGIKNGAYVSLGHQRPQQAQRVITQHATPVPVNIDQMEAGVFGICFYLTICPMALKSMSGEATADTDGGMVGRDKVSATTICGPLMCRISAVNSAIYHKCLDCCGVLSIALDREKVRGI